MKLIPEKYQDLLAEETRALAFLATTMKDGSPQVTPVWFNLQGEHIWINSAEGRTKDRNMRARPQIALAIMDIKEPYRYLQVRGRVVEITTEGADDHMDALSKKYMGETWRGDETRVIYKIEPQNVAGTE